MTDLPYDLESVTDSKFIRRAGLYTLEVLSVDPNATTRGGDPKVEFTEHVVGPVGHPDIGATITDDISKGETSAWRMKRKIGVLGGPSKGRKVDWQGLVGKQYNAEVFMEPFTGRDGVTRNYSKIQDVFPYEELAPYDDAIPDMVPDVPPPTPASEVKFD